MAAFAQHHGIDYAIAGRALEFWKKNMPPGMLLRSGSDWHLDPLEIDTIEAFLVERGTTPAEAEPLSRDLYLAYGAWFLERKGIEPRPALVTKLDLLDGGGYSAELDDGTSLGADNVLLAVGFGYFANVPPELASIIPAARRSHTCECVDLGAFAGRRCLIVGGRQSAFEWAALLRESGAARIHVCHRHDTPAFAESDWSWVKPMMERSARQPAWFRELPEQDREALNGRFWQEGRGKLEPWLGPRIDHPSIELLPHASVSSCRELPSGSVEIRLDDGRRREVDHVILATGYKVDMARVGFLSQRIHGEMRTEDGFPLLSTGMETSVPGLYVTSLAATRAFGLFFGFTSAARASATIVGSALLGASR